MPNRNVRDFSFFNAVPKRRNCPSVRCPSVANGIGSELDIFNGRSVSVNDWLVPDYSIVLGTVYPF